MNRITEFPSKRCLVTVLIILAALGANAQVQSAVPQRSNPPMPPTVANDSAFKEKLVTLALGGPQYDAATHATKIAQYKVRSAKLSWFNLLTLSLNYNELSFSKENALYTAYVYPKYFFGLVIPIGTIVSKGAEIKAAREEVKIGQDNEVILARQIRADVLTKYAQYKNYRELAVIENQIVDDLSANFSQAEKKFRDGAITIEAFGVASSSFNTENAKKLQMQLLAEITKYDLERLIGVRLETVSQ